MLVFKGCLGKILSHLIGCEKDKAKTLELYTKAADGGLEEGLYNLGLLYDQGIG